MGGYFTSTTFEDVVREAKGPVTFYDSNTGKPLFMAPINRSAEDFIRESEIVSQLLPSLPGFSEC